MKRRLIISGSELRDTIAYITAPSAGRRVVVTAFIGPDALAVIPEPKGVEVYCWDHSSGTDPEGVADLMEGARVWFVTGLHMKIYWSQRRGVLIGSPNLSRNALGENAALLEYAVYYDDSSAIKISKIEDLLRNRRRPAEDWIDDLRRRSNRDPVARRGTRRRSRTLREYFSLDYPAPWRVAFWSGHSGNHTAEDYGALAGANGIDDVAEAKERLRTSIPAPHGTTPGDWLLSVIWPRQGKPKGPLEWINVASVANVSGGRRAYQLLGRHQSPPFDCKEKGFAIALRRFLVQLVSENEQLGMTMTPKRIRLLAKILKDI